MSSSTSPQYKFTNFLRTGLKWLPKNKTTKLTDDEDSQMYIVENDEDELDRQTVQHYICRLCFDGNFTAPMEDLLQRGAKVLEVGCGPATWSLEMSSTFPNSQFFGFDVEEVFPTTIMPQNCFFEVADATKLPLPYNDNEFDLVCMRFFANVLTAENWPKILRELVRITKEGGYVQVVDANFDFKCLGPNTDILIQALQKAMRLRGLNPTVATKLPTLLAEAGLVNVHDEMYSTPVGKFEGTKLGVLVKENWAHSVKAYSPLLVKMRVMNEKDIDRHVGFLFDEVEEYGTREEFWAVYGQKPKAN